MKIEEFNNVSYVIGETSKENWEILDLYKSKNPNFVWFHLNSFPSCYVIMLTTIDNIVNEPSKYINISNYLNYGALICKKNTKYRNLLNLKICYTTLSKLQRGEKIGEVKIIGKYKIIKL